MIAPIVLGLLGLVTLAGLALGGRHLYLRVDRPGGFECSLRVVHGEIPGLTGRFRAGHAGRELDDFVWRRVAWPSPAVRFPAGAVRLDRERAPSPRDHLLSVPAHFAILPVELPDGIRLDLALARGKLTKITTALG